MQQEQFSVQRVNVMDMMKEYHVTLHVSGLPELRVRLWLGRLLIKAAAWVIRCRVEIKENGETD